MAFGFFRPTPTVKLARWTSWSASSDSVTSGPKTDRAALADRARAAEAAVLEERRKAEQAAAAEQERLRLIAWSAAALTVQTRARVMLAKPKLLALRVRDAEREGRYAWCRTQWELFRDATAEARAVPEREPLLMPWAEGGV